MKTRIRIVLLITGVVLFLALAGCGGSNGGEEMVPDTDEPDTTQVPNEPNAPDTTYTPEEPYIPDTTYVPHNFDYPEPPDVPDTASIYNYNIFEQAAHLEIVKTLTDEPAHIFKGCYTNIEGIKERELFYIALDGVYLGLMIKVLLPCEAIPVQYRREWLPVRISGHVTDSLFLFCEYPHTRMWVTRIIRDLEIDYKD
ncbi:MAG: hypothetical protein LBD21_00935 [Tannerellaceae bacterium]|jgi:hypothetical protein|nr:hypothetical protein [Tannerellaceae bacterium]